MFREAGTQVPLVTTAPPCLPLDIKNSLKEDTRLFALSFLLEAFAFGFWDFGF
jgi:hypothetical protein